MDDQAAQVPQEQISPDAQAPVAPTPEPVQPIESVQPEAPVEQPVQEAPVQLTPDEQFLKEYKELTEKVGRQYSVVPKFMKQEDGSFSLHFLLVIAPLE